MDGMKRVLLLVEDESVTALREKVLLESHGYTVVHAADRDAVLAQLRDQKVPDLVLMDVDLGDGPDGITIAGEILQDYDLPVVFLTSHTERELIERAGEVSGFGYVIKNSGDFVLLAAVKTALQLFDARRKLAESGRNLAEKEQRYRQLFERMLNGFALHEILLDRDGVPCDYRFLEINPAFEQMTGLSAQQVVGRRVLEVLPDTEPVWIERYGRVALGGGPECFEHFSAALGRYYRVTAYAPRPGFFAVLFEDVTRSKTAELELQQSELRYRQLVENIDELICELDASGRFLYVNSRYRDVLGYEPAQLPGKNITDLIVPEQVREVDARYRLIVEDGGAAETVWGFLHADGSRRDFSCRSRVFQSTGGRVRTVMICRDVTEELLAEVQRRHELEVFQFLLECALALEQITAVDALFKFVSDRMAFLLPDSISVLVRCHEDGEGTEVAAVRGLQEELAGRLAAAFGFDPFVCKYEVSSGFREQYCRPMLQEVHGGLFAYCSGLLPEDRARRIEQAAGIRHCYTAGLADGDRYYGYLHFFCRGEVDATRKGLIESFVHLCYLAMDRLYAVSQLFRSRSELRTMFEQSGVGIALMDSASGRFVRVNQKYCEITGFPSNELEGMNFRTITHPDDIEGDNANLQRLLNRETESYRVLKRYLHREGRSVWCQLTVTALGSSEDGRLQHMTVAEDVSERINAEQQVTALLEEKELLLREVHHRIKNNLTTIAELLGLQVDRIENATAKDALNDARSRVLSMLKLYEELYRRHRYTEVDSSSYIAHLIREVVGSFAGGELVKPELELDSIMLPPRQAVPLGILLNELVTNTMKYAPVPDRVLQLRIRFAAAGSMLELEFSDNGPGFKAGEDLSGSGGFGLQLIRLLAGQLGAEVQFDGDPGCRYRFRFPAG